MQIKSLIKFKPDFMPLIEKGNKTITRRPITELPDITGADKFEKNLKWANGVFMVSRPPAKIMIPCRFGAVGQTIDAMAASKPAENKTADMAPQRADKLELAIVDVRPERLQDISISDAFFEGIPLPGMISTDGRQKLTNGHYSPPGMLESFIQIWDECYSGKKAWAANPWVWRIEFKLINNNQQMG